MYPDLGSKQYEFIKRIGGGGFGVVNLAIDLYSGKPVAIKSIHKNYNDRNDLIENFKREANIYLDLSHPIIVKLNAFIINNGVQLVMDYVEGSTLEDFINNETGPIPAKLCLELLNDIISAIDYAHNKNISINGYEIIKLWLLIMEFPKVQLRKEKFLNIQRCIVHLNNWILIKI